MKLQFIDPGKLRTELRVEEATDINDEMGGIQQAWNEIAIVFGQLEPVSAHHFHGAGQWHSTVSHQVTIRFRQDVRSGMRLVAHRRIFQILNVYDVEERGRYLLCKLREHEV